MTGGIASGISTVADMFAELGVPVIDTDVIAREVVAPGEPALDEIAERFGEHMIDAAGNLDRNAMRKLVFADDAARTELESILHPRIGAETLRQAEAAGGESPDSAPVSSTDQSPRDQSAQEHSDLPIVTP